MNSGPIAKIGALRHALSGPTTSHGGGKALFFVVGVLIANCGVLDILDAPTRV